MEKLWRVIADSFGNGYSNMAVDEALVRSYQKTKIPVLRVYGWDKPFVTLGCNQNVSDVLIDQTGDFTRRMTGGAAILHDRELTYSIVCSKTDLDIAGSVKDSYKKLCSFLIDFYLNLGLKAHFACDHISSDLGGYRNICFLSYEHYDILINDKKIGGNAQKRGRDFIFQHGSIPQSIDYDLMGKKLKFSSGVADKAAGLDAFLGKKSDFKALQEKLISSFQRVFNINLAIGSLSSDEQGDCVYLLEKKYLNDDWKNKTAVVE